MPNSPIRNISDTARWVAAYRAEESAREDALFHDILADRLAGPRGREMAARATVHSRWSLITRTRPIDDLVLTSVAQGTDCVVNLAAGFDTRPYRLSLPEDLSWIEADLPALMDEKQALLAAETPRCKLVRHGVDLSDAEARAALLHEATGEARRALVITEGLLIYLEATMVEQLAQALASEPSIHEWIADFSSPEIVQMMRRSVGDALTNSPFRLELVEGLAHFERCGWKPAQVQSLVREGLRLRRLPGWMVPFAWLPQPSPRSPKGRWSVLARFERASG